MTSDPMPLRGQTFDNRQQSMAGVVKMWSGRLMEAQHARRDAERELEEAVRAVERLRVRLEVALELLTDEQLTKVAETAAVRLQNLESRGLIAPEDSKHDGSCCG